MQAVGFWRCVQVMEGLLDPVCSDMALSSMERSVTINVDDNKVQAEGPFLIGLKKLFCDGHG